MFQAEIDVRVRYSETDQMGYVYYGNYAAYYEVARTETFRSLGVNYKEMEKAGVMMPVLDLRCKFIRPARYDDLLTIKVMIPNKPHGSRIKFEYEVYNEAKELLNIGETTLVFVDMRTSKPTAIPESLVLLLQGYY